MELVQTLDFLHSKYNEGFNFLVMHDANKHILNTILAKCEKRVTFDNINEYVITDIGRVNIKIYTKSYFDILDKQIPDALIHYTPI